MNCRIDEIKSRQVVCVRDGTVLGYVSDIELDTLTGRLTSLIIMGGLKFLGLFGREEDIIIPWEDIAVIGEETILVNCNPLMTNPVPKRR